MYHLAPRQEIIGIDVHPVNKQQIYLSHTYQLSILMEAKQVDNGPKPYYSY